MIACFSLQMEEGGAVSYITNIPTYALIEGEAYFLPLFSSIFHSIMNEIIFRTTLYLSLIVKTAYCVL